MGFLTRAPWPAVVVLVLAVAAAVPSFLRLPPWADLTLYDVAARNMLAGGVHYRDVFDTNLPGFVWALAGIRWLLGPSTEVVRAVDLGVVAGIAWLLAALAGRAGAGPAARWWLLAGAALFYPFTPEINHAQRDVWMLLPAAGATLLRVRRATDSRLSPLVGGLIEGAVWGLAVWVKPHAVVPCAAVWLATARRGWLLDAAGYLLGGGLAGAVGVGYLYASGTWASFVEVFTVWNQGYFARALAETYDRLPLELVYFPPWSYLHVVGVPLAGVLFWKPGPAGKAVAALYLGWLFQAAFFQRDIPYIHVPEILLLLAVLAVGRLPAVPLLVGWFAVLPLLAAPPEPRDGRGAVPREHGGWRTRHPLTTTAFWNTWPNCWRSLPPADAARRMDALARVERFHGGANWAEQEEVADWLTGQGVRDGEVLCWDDSPHALYLRLGVRPGFRFQHVHQMRGLDAAARARVDAELDAALPRARWVVGDLRFAAAVDARGVGDWTEAGPDLLPPDLSDGWRDQFPFTLRPVFRSGGGNGRYVVYAVR